MRTRQTVRVAADIVMASAAGSPLRAPMKPLAALVWVEMEAEASLLGSNIISVEFQLHQLSLTREVRPSMGTLGTGTTD